LDNNVTVECRLRSEPEKVTMSVIFLDHGRYFNPLDYPLPDTGLPLDQRDAGGLGLLIVRKTMDTIQYSRGNGTSREDGLIREDGLNRLEFSKSWQKEKQ
jgi:anti-sigma regulatory factor (Ser/Thr protein kinase)